MSKYISAMSISFQWQAQDTEVVVAIACLTIGFVAYWFIAQSPKMARYFNANFPKNQAGVYHILFQRYTGFVFLGIIPTVIVLVFLPQTWQDYGASFDIKPATWYWIGGLTIVVFVLSYINAKKADNLAMYPQIRLENWQVSTFAHEYLSWTAYLVAYEFLFRGIFLFACYRAFGVWAAMALNASAYSLSHLPKGQKETVGAIPVGILFSYATLSTGTVWVAMIIHILMALSNSAYSFYFQPNMKFKRKYTQA